MNLFLATRTCKTGYHSCTNGRCVLESKHCDGRDDCGDNTDETNCTCDPRKKLCFKKIKYNNVFLFAKCQQKINKW